MEPLVLLGLLAGLPFILSIVLRVHASAFFISVAGGYLLTQFIGDTTGLITGSLVKNSGDTALLIVCLAPVIITFWFMRKSLPSSQIFIQFLPQLATSLMLFAVLLPLLPSDMSSNLQSDNMARELIVASDAIVLFAVVLQVLLMIITSRPPSHPKKGHH